MICSALGWYSSSFVILCLFHNGGAMMAPPLHCSLMVAPHSQVPLPLNSSVDLFSLFRDAQGMVAGLGCECSRWWSGGSTLWPAHCCSCMLFPVQDIGVFR